MIVVVSQAWTLDAENAARDYAQAWSKLARFMREQAGFRRRQLIRGVEDPTHFTHLRWFDSVEDYQRMTQHPDYPARIQELSRFLDLERYARADGTGAREFMQVVLDD